MRSFADGDGDGIGDLAGLTAKLDYLNDGDPATTDDLGVGGLWLMPIAESARATTATTSPTTAGRARLRHAGRPRRLPRRGPRARDQGHRGPRDEPQLQRAPVVHRTPPPARATRRTGTCGRTSTRAGSGPGGQVAWHELDGRVLLRRVLGRDAGPQPAQRRRSRRSSRTSRGSGSPRSAWTGSGSTRRSTSSRTARTPRRTPPRRTPGSRASRTPWRRANPDALLVGEVWDPASVAGGVRPRQPRPDVRLRARDRVPRSRSRTGAPRRSGPRSSTRRGGLARRTRLATLPRPTTTRPGS